MTAHIAPLDLTPPANPASAPCFPTRDLVAAIKRAAREALTGNPADVLLAEEVLMICANGGPLKAARS